MSWIILSFLTALFNSLGSVISKKSLKDVDEYTVAFASIFFAFILSLPLLFFIQVPNVGKPFLIALITSGILNSIALVFIMKALKHSDISLVSPLITFTPLFLLLTSPFMVGEIPSSLGLIGVLLIVIGSYTLNIKERRKGFFEPIKALIKHKGSRYMLLVAFIYSISSNLDKIGIQDSSPLFWAISSYAIRSILLFGLIFFISRKSLTKTLDHVPSLFFIGLFGLLSFSFQVMAINLTLVSYVISIKRTSVIMSVLFGYFFFKEKGIRDRLVGSIIMIVGFILITFS